MADDSKELINTLMGMLGDNPEEKIASVLSGLNTEKDSPSASREEGNDTGELEALFKIGNLFSEISTEDNRACLLNALKPFLSEGRRPKVDSAIKLLRLARIAEAAGKTDILKNFKL
ncbi:MAG: hypothetical protein IKU15_06440 [Clostridia bacterium]|nr:hypothetical protein [Clostridia bacterium]